MILLYVAFFLGVPVVLSLINIATVIEAFTKSRKILDYSRKKYIDVITLVLGSGLSIIFWNICDFREYYEPIKIPVDLVNLHSPINAEHIPTILFFLICGYLAYLLLRFKLNDLTPLVFAISMSAIVLANILGLLFVAQLSNHILIDYTGNFSILTEGIVLSILPFNFFIVSSLLVRDVVNEYLDPDKEYQNAILKNINLVLIK